MTDEHYQTHTKRNSWWLLDARGIELCKVCTECEAAAKEEWRHCIITGYDQSDVDEPIEEEEW